MTIASALARQEHQQQAPGTLKVFSYPFKIFAAADIRVTLVSGGVETVQTLTLHYTVDGVGAATGGNVTFVSAPSTDDYIILELVRDVIQQTNFHRQGGFNPETHEAAFDKVVQLVMQHENLLRSNDRANARVPILRTKDLVGVGDGGFDCLSNQVKNMDDPTAPQDAVTLASLGAGIVYDVIFPVFTEAEFAALNVQTTEYELVRVWESLVAMRWEFRCRKKDGTYEWVPGPSASPF